MRASDLNPSVAGLSPCPAVWLFASLATLLSAMGAAANGAESAEPPKAVGTIHAHTAAADTQMTPRRLIDQAGGTQVTRRVAIDGLNEPLSEWRLSDFDGRDLSAELRPQRQTDQVTVALERPRQFVMKPRAVVTLETPERGRLTLPGGVVVALPSNDGTAPSKAAWFRLTFAASPMPAPWDPDAAGYLTRLTFGLTRPAQVPESVRLDRPVVIKLGYEGLTADELPPLAIDAPGLEHEKTVELRFKPSTSAPRLLVRSTISDVDLALSALPRLDVRPQQRTMLGFGLETVAVVVENVTAHGEPRVVERATPIAIELDGGARAEVDEIEFAAGRATASLRVRSSGVRPVHITATAGGVSGRARIEQRWPLAPLLAALLGGALGGYVRRFVKGARRSRTALQTLEGALVALVAFAAGVLGVGYLNLPPALVATEAGAFFTGAVAGLAGVAVMEMMGKKRTETAG